MQNGIQNANGQTPRPPPISAPHRPSPPHDPPGVSSPTSPGAPRSPPRRIHTAMTTLIPREAYSPEELQRLYPKDLKLQLVQVVSLAYLFYRAERVGVQLIVRPTPAVLASWYGLTCAIFTLYVVYGWFGGDWIDTYSWYLFRRTYACFVAVSKCMSPSFFVQGCLVYPGQMLMRCEDRPEPVYALLLFFFLRHFMTTAS